MLLVSGNCSIEGNCDTEDHCCRPRFTIPCKVSRARRDDASNGTQRDGDKTAVGHIANTNRHVRLLGDRINSLIRYRNIERNFRIEGCKLCQNRCQLVIGKSRAAVETNMTARRPNRFGKFGLGDLNGFLDMSRTRQERLAFSVRDNCRVDRKSNFVPRAVFQPRNHARHTG